MTTIKVKRILYIELYVANIVQAAFFYISAFSFKVVNEKKIENEKEVSIVLIQRNIKLILTSSKRITGKITEQVNLYGDFVKDIAFEVQNIEPLHQQAVKYGFISIAEPKEDIFYGKKVKQSIIATLGNIQHTLIEKINLSDALLLDNDHEMELDDNMKCSIQDIDHIAIAVDNLTKWQDLYAQGLGFYSFYKETIETKHSGMDSVVMNSQNDFVKFVFVSPKQGTHKSQIQKYLDYNNNTPGVQHFAFSTENIMAIVAKLRKINVEFLGSLIVCVETQKWYNFEIG